MARHTKAHDRISNSMGITHRVPLRGESMERGSGVLPYPALLAAQLKPDIALNGTQCFVVGIQFLSLR